MSLGEHRSEKVSATSEARVLETSTPRTDHFGSLVNSIYSNAMQPQLALLFHYSDFEFAFYQFKQGWRAKTVPTQIFGTSTNVLYTTPSFCFVMTRILPFWVWMRGGRGCGFEFEGDEVDFFIWWNSVARRDDRERDE